MITKILAVRDQPTNAGKPRWVIETTSGNMFCWDEKLSIYLRSMVNNEQELDIKKSADGKFSNVMNAFTPSKGDQQVQQVTHSFPAASLDKDRLIVRQSCLKAACDAVQHTTHVDLSDHDMMINERVLKLAEEFENWVFR